METEMRSDILRVDDVEADVECLMCARVIGQLFGHRWRRLGERRTVRTVANLTTYRENEPGAEPRPVWPAERFRCRHCGGPGYIGDILAHAVTEAVPSELCPVHTDPVSGPGRPPKGCRCERKRLAA